MNAGAFAFAGGNSAVKSSLVESVGVWKDFRKNDYPFHIQTVAFDEKTGTLIISEPPPHVTLDDFKKINPVLEQAVISEEHPIGYDGWVKDLIVPLPEMDKAARQNLFDQINVYLFHTSYKSDVLSLPVNKSSFDKTALDVTVTNADLQDWLITKNEVFESLMTGEQVQFNNLVSQKKSGVYLSSETGLVVWAIDRKKPLNDYLAQARQFALDSDLIVGAISNADMLAIVGRERILPTDVFPPLRTETIMRLAAITNPDLAQSYERKYVFAGKFNEKDDWAPIYLSDELIDSEYGSLLNITDQILKSWSMHGTISYRGFESYKLPKDYPFGDKTLMEFLNINEVTFNWNTFGVGYSSEDSGKRIFALNRTGALPTSYLGENEDNYSQAEEIGYKYFAEIGDANLTRVVQYAGLYQIFQDSKVTIPKDYASFPKYVPDNKDLYNELFGIIKEIKDLSAEDIESFPKNDKFEKFAANLNTIRNFNNPKDLEAAVRSMLEPRNLSNETNKKMAAFQKSFDTLLKQELQTEASLKAKVKRHDEIVSFYNANCVGINLPTAEYNKCLGYRSQVSRLEVEIKNLENKDYSLQLQIINLASSFGVFYQFNEALREAFDFLSIINSFYNPSEVNRLREVYLKSLPTRNSGWIHTPSIVISSSDDIGAIGGHNLGSKITIFKTGKVLPGKVQIVEQNGKQVIIANSNDMSKISALVRNAAVKSRDSVSLKKYLEQNLVVQKPVLPVAKKTRLELPTEVSGKTPTRVGNFLPRTENQGWISNRKTDAFNDDFVRIMKRDDGTEIINYRNRETLANSPTSRNDFLKNMRFEENVPVKIKLENFSEGEANVLMKNMELNYPNHQKMGFIRRIKSSGGKYLAGDYNLAQAKISAPKIETVRRNGAEVTRVSIDVEVPPVAPNNPKLFFRVVNFFKGAVGKVKQQQIVQKFQMLLNSKLRVAKYSSETDAQKIASEVKSEIEKAFPDGFDADVYFYDATVSENLNLNVENDANAE
ncbi:hypothetical protein BH10ACI1_BH10ACI1_30870 [soil metagenome]